MKYSELSDEAKRKALEWGREAQSEDSWFSECVTEDWKATLEYLGFYGVDVLWTGFYSQGDGACFVGNWQDKYVCFDRLVEYLGVERAESMDCYGFFRKIEALRGMGAIEPHYVALRHKGLYSHKHSVTYDYDIPEAEDDTIPDFESDFKEACQSLMEDIYSDLEKEYDYQMSDEAVAEMLEVNEFDFNEKGERQ